MAGFVAVIRHDAQMRSAVEHELHGLVRAYGELRNESEHSRLEAGELASIVLLAGEYEPRCESEATATGWAAWLGTVFAGAKGPITAMPAELDGQFALLRFDALERRVELLSDPFGLQAVYVAERVGTTLVSTSALALARHLRSRPSRLGIEVFMRSGPHFGELTNWEGITRLPPAAQLTFDVLGTRDRTVYWRPELEQSLGRLDQERAARQCVDVAVSALTERYRNWSNSWCDLTGGFDSRLASLLLDHSGVSFKANTVGPADAADVVLGKQVASAAGWQWARSEPESSPDRWQAQAADALSWGDGQMEIVQLAGVLDGHRKRAGTATSLFAGGGGEHWRDYAWQQEGPLGGRTHRVAFQRWVDMRFLQPMDTSPFASDPTPGVRENLVERCRSYVTPFAEELNSVQLDMLYALKSMAHFGAYQTAARGVMAAELPFYAKPVFTSAFSVAPKHRNFHRLMRRAIALLDPHIASLPTTAGGPAEPLRAGNINQFRPYLANRSRGAIRKVTQRLPGPTLGSVPPRRFEFEAGLRGHLLADLDARTNLDPQRMRTGRMYHRERLRSLLRSPEATTRGWNTVGRIITLELSLEAVDACLE
jgi:hypothetical protein